jgi:pimeloyl-ACP methyl ester carboxylesterase
MNERVLRHDAPDDAGEGDVDDWSRLEQVTVPTTVVWGDRDLPPLIESCRTVAARVPGARTHVLAGVAHLPSLDAPDELAAVLQASTPGR